MSMILFTTRDDIKKDETFKCQIIGNMMLQYEADLKMRRHFGGDILETP